ncbi:MAG: hypothetical protein L0229_20645 [Blastocatellia bacterium]|nr:hypothetical protein [Blastocatellia bacterium]
MSILKQLFTLYGRYSLMKTFDRTVVPPKQQKAFFGASLERHKAFFASRAVGETLLVSESKQSVGGAWKMVAEWDASHSVPRRGDGKRINPPELVDWSPDGEELVTACDAFGMTRWLADGRRVGGGTDPDAWGHPTRFFWSPDGDLILLVAETGNNWWSIQDKNGSIIRQVMAYKGVLDPWGSDSMESYGFYRTRCFNPWRPGTRQLLIERGEGPRLDLIDIMDLPEPGPPNQSTLAHVVQVVGALVRGALGERIDITLADVPVVASVSFEELGAQDRRIMRYAWDPSGQYVAVTTGHPDKKSVRQVHILHYDTGEIVASIPSATTAIGWSPGGRLVFCQRWTNAYTSEWTIETAIWDSHIWTLRDISEEERNQPWARQFEFSRLGVGQSALNADGTLIANPDGQHGVAIRRVDSEEIEAVLPMEGAVAHAAWSPIDPQCIATVGGDDGRSLRLWRWAPE